MIGVERPRASAPPLLAANFLLRTLRRVGRYEADPVAFRASPIRLSALPARDRRAILFVLDVVSLPPWPTARWLIAPGTYRLRLGLR